MNAWQSVKVSELGRVVTGKTPKTAISENYGGDVPFLTPSDDMSVKYVSKTVKTLTEKGLSEVKNTLLPQDAVCVSCIGSDLGKVVITTKNTVTNQQINSIIVDKEHFDVSFVYYAMLILGKELNFISKTSTAVPIVNKSSFSSYEIQCPSLEQQKQIAAVLSLLDDKIENNQKLNDNLYAQARAVFDDHFINLDVLPDGWNKGNLLDIASYLNGLAMQKFRPQGDEISLPVLKIKELRQGLCDNSSERCTSSIKPEYIIHDGDVIFSWSGSLLVDIWCGGTCGLNQHLFKVTSNIYDKWFYYLSTPHHLARFVAIPADKDTTMGHIKREELAKAEVLIPCEKDYKNISSIIQPIFELIISNQIEARKLAALRDELLPQLMSGEIDVSAVEI